MNTRVTMADVAAAAGVSTMSVSYTYNQPNRVSDATKDRVHAAAAHLGYTGPNRAARSLRSGKHNSIGVVLGEKLTYAFEDPQARRFLSGIADACLDADTALVMLPNLHRDKDIARIRDAQVDGYVVWTTESDDPLLDALVDTGRPTCIQGGPDHPGLEWITIDDRAAADAVATVALDDRTHPAIVALRPDSLRTSTVVRGADPSDVSMPVTRARLDGYRDACLRLGIDWSTVPTLFTTHNARAEGARAARLLLQDNMIDTLLVMSDELALGALDAAAAFGVEIPSQLAVTGWDDSTAAAAAGLTTVAQSLFDQGRSAARWVLGLNDSVDAAAWRVEERGSTGLETGPKPCPT
ncbi:LacI family DNA-binding transcriptional regulator [Rhodococcoides yunnanense]|uniref:LacI family DNA-binding transcriptional regulator n=1 Tax=Rhodococcoides yunnanense TaxID=278209 RepID=A0ABU4B951_9NOCA|nr:LacI family DNA-binding transcriptional regulator [Rhodococcus yunnanensis]MDV6260681.1 LacI family DNA-binding transcriptional regulator [Rhodococcus yunnanensis]